MTTENTLQRELDSTTFAPAIFRGEPLKGYSISKTGIVFDEINQAVVPPMTNEFGYQLCKVWRGAQIYFARVHRLVAETFIPNPDNLPEVDHINCNKSDNWVENLEWVSSSKNKRRAILNGRYDNASCMRVGSDRPNTIYNEETIHKICQMLQDRKSNKEIIEALGVNKQIIGVVIGKHAWTHISKNYDLPAPGERSTFRKYTPDVIHDICRRITAGEDLHSIATATSTPYADVYAIRIGKRFNKISQQYNFPPYEMSYSYPLEDVHRVCKMLEQGRNLTDITSAIKSIPPTTIRNIRFGRAHRDIRSQYIIPEDKKLYHQKPYRDDVVRMLREGYSTDYIIKELNLPGTNQDHAYISKIRQKIKSEKY